MWRQPAPSPIKRGEIASLETSPDGRTKGIVVPVDSEQLFPLQGYAFRADTEVYKDTQPFLSRRLPVTFEIGGNQIKNIGLDFSRLRHGTLQSFNGRSGWIRDEKDSREVYFDKKCLLNSRPLSAARTRVAYFTSPDFDAKALLVYPDDGLETAMNGHRAMPPMHSRTPSPFSEEDELAGSTGLSTRSTTSRLRRQPSMPSLETSPSTRFLLARSPPLQPLGVYGSISHIEHSEPSLSSCHPGLHTVGRLSTRAEPPLLPPLPPLDIKTSTRTSRPKQLTSARSIANFGLKKSSASMAGPSLPGISISSGLGLTGLEPSHGLRRTGSLSAFKQAPLSDHFAGSEDFDRMPLPALSRASDLSLSHCPLGLPELPLFPSGSFSVAAPLPRSRSVRTRGDSLGHAYQQWKDDSLNLFPA